MQSLEETQPAKEEEEAYDVTKFYKENSRVADLARSKSFEHTTLVIISINAVWIGVDTDWNNAADLNSAKLQFRVAENIFCIYFTAEVIIRFLAFARKCNACRDGWFKFDGFLVSCMILETWIIPLMQLLSGGGDSIPLGNLSILRLLRLLRLTRITRLMRAVPELLTLIKGMIVAARSVFSTLVLLIAATYVFAIIFTQQLGGIEASDDDPEDLVAMQDMFGCMGLSMLTLFVNGTLLDDLTAVLKSILFHSQIMMWVFVVYIVLSSLTILNMLIGVLCEVVSETAKEEEESATLAQVNGCLQHAFKQIDNDGNGLVSKEEFSKLAENEEARKALEMLGLDLSSKDNLERLTNSVFTPEGVTTTAFVQEESVPENNAVVPQANPSPSGSKSRASTCRKVGDGESMEWTFEQFVEQVIAHRPSTNANVLDCAQLRSVMKQDLKRLERLIDNIRSDIDAEKMRVTAQVSEHSSMMASPARREKPALGHHSTDVLFTELLRRTAAHGERTGLRGGERPSSRTSNNRGLGQAMMPVVPGQPVPDFEADRVGRTAPQTPDKRSSKQLATFGGKQQSSFNNQVPRTPESVQTVDLQ